MPLREKISAKNFGYILAVSVVVLFIGICGSLLINNESQAGVSGDGNFTIEPLLTGYDDVVGKTNKEWTFTVTTTAELAAGDVIKFIFPSGLTTTDFDLSSATTSAIGGVTLYSSLATTTYSDVITDGGVESWYFGADDWTVMDWVASDATLFQRSADKHGGTYAQSMSTDSSGNSDIIYQVVSVTSTDDLQATFWAKSSSTDALFLSYMHTDGDRVYNFTSSSWENFTGSITSDHRYTPVLSNSYQQFTSPTSSLAGETVASAWVMFIPSGGANYTAIIDDVEILVSSVDVATNGNFESWTPTTLISWFDSYWTTTGGNSNLPTLISSTTIKQAGVYSAVLNINNSSGNRNKYIGQSYSGSAGDNYRFSFYSRKTDNSSANVSSTLSFFNGTSINSSTQYYNFSNNSWVEYTPTSTMPTSDYYYGYALTTDWQQFTFSNAGLVVPASGIITPVIWPIGDTSLDAMYIDEMALERVTNVVAVEGIVYNSSATTTIYGMVTSTLASSTAFSITIGGITNGSDPGSNYSVSNLTWQVIAGTPTNSAQPYGTLSETKFTLSAVDNLLIPWVTSNTATATATEGGATGSYTIFLNTKPTDDVTVTITPDAQITVSTSSIIFTSANWSTPQTITVTAVNDDIDEESAHTGLIAHSATSTDTDYVIPTIGNITVTVTDNDTAGITKSETALAVTENSTTSTYTIVLDTEPTADVIVSLSASSSLATLSTSTLTFTSANWSSTQTVTVSRADNDVDNPELTDYILHTVSSTDANYEGFSVANVTVVITDDDTFGITNSETAIAVTEGSTTDTYTVVLDTEPTANVVITPSATGSKVTFSASTLTFTSANWSTPQTITVTAVDDSTVEGTHTDTITHSATSDDTNYNGATIADVTITITDNDTASSGSGTPSVPVPAVPVVVSAPTVQSTITANTPTVVSVGNVSHTVTVGTPSANGSVVIIIQSDPITFTMKAGEEKLLDTDKNGEDDLFVRLDEIVGNSVKLTISAIKDLEFSINNALSYTDNRSVILYFNSPDANLMAISNSSDFINTSFETYKKTKTWTLTENNGTKTVYVKFRAARGGTKTVSDTIILTNQTLTDNSNVIKTEECPLTIGSAYKLANVSSVYYITSDCTKRAFKRSDVFFTYFNSWGDVKTTTQTLLNSITNDTLGFMPWGPKYDPKYGALVKIVTDPKVYLLLGTEKYWIISEVVFNALNYAWNWIEDIDVRLLDKYTTGSEITYTDHHPNYTLIKYENDAKVYRLESDIENTAKQVKCWIVDENAFNSLNFRWDRIVTVDSTEEYTEGEELK